MLKTEIHSILSKHNIKYTEINPVCFTVEHKSWLNKNKISVFVFKENIKIVISDENNDIIYKEDFTKIINIPLKINEFKKINETLNNVLF